MEKIKEITVNELEKNIKEYLIIDIRDEISFQHGHIKDAVLLEKQNELECVKKNMNENKKDKVVVYCSVGEKSKSLAEKLQEYDIDVYSLSGGYHSWLMEKDKILDNYDISRYHRQMILPEIGRDGQEKIKKAKILIVGAGGLGSPAALYLASAGIGTIGIVDGDRVTLNNLQRQILHKEDCVGSKKVESARKHLRELNSHVEIKMYDTYLTSENINLINDYDFIIDGVDNFETKFLINDACVIAKKAFTHAGISKYQGQIMTWVPNQNCCCYRCVFEEVPAVHIPNCSENGIMGAVAGIAGSIQALEAIKYITESGELLTNKIYIFDGLTMNTRIVNFKKRETCDVCGTNPVITNVVDSERYNRNSCSL